MKRATPALFRNIWRHQSGASALEFAIIAPIFLFIILFFIQTSYALFSYNALEYALNEGSRYLYFNVGDTDGALRVITDTAASGILDTRQLSVFFEHETEPYSRLEIIGIYRFEGIGLLLPTGPFDMNSTVSVAMAE